MAFLPRRPNAATEYLVMLHQWTSAPLSRHVVTRAAVWATLHGTAAVSGARDSNRHGTAVMKDNLVVSHDRMAHKAHALAEDLVAIIARGATPATRINPVREMEHLSRRGTLY